jgi:glycosyltransferase involved in cell wall biosynthesis
MSRKIPVLIAGTSCLSGVTSWAEQLRVALADHPRFEVKLIHIGKEGSHSADLRAQTVEDAHRMVRSMSPVIVMPNYVWSLFMTGFEPGVHCVGMCHADSAEQYYRPLSWYEPAIAKYVAVSPECARTLTQYVPVRSSDIAMLPYGVRVPGELNRCYQAKPLRLIYAGRVTQPQKRVWDFLPLVEQLLRAKVPFEFDIVGEGDEFEPLRRILEARVPAANVHFHHRVPHARMAGIWSNHDIFLQVSDFEGTSVSMLEAMALGVVPVVTAASSGISGVIQHGRNGFVVPVGDMNAMAQVIAQLTGDESTLTTVGRAAHVTAQAYAMDSYARKFAAILDQVADSPMHVDYQKRYGVFSPVHPLILQRQLLQAQQHREEQSAEPAARRSFIRPFKLRSTPERKRVA